MRTRLSRNVFVTGATGYLGRPLVARLVARGHVVRALVRPSIRASVEAARAAGVRHLVYVSVAHPAPVMRAYIAVRQEGERLIRASGLAATILRPWYVLGPGHRWPCLLLPIYAVLGRLPSTRESALRLGLVTYEQMLRALLRATEKPPAGVREIDVPQIRRAHR